MEITMRKFFLYCMVVIIISLVGCVSNKYTNVRSTEQSKINPDKVLKENSKEDDLVLQFDIIANEVSFNEGKVTIRYPYITGIENDDDEKKINEIIKNEVMSYLQPIENIDVGQNYSIDFDVKCSNNKLLSIIYYGSEFLEGSAYPIDVFFSTNIDLIGTKKLKLIDVIKDYEALVEVFTSILIEENDDEMKKTAYDYIYQTYNRDDLIKGFTEADDTYGSGRYIFSYVTNESIGFSWEVPHVIGDHVEIEIPFEKLINIIDFEKIG